MWVEVFFDMSDSGLLFQASFSLPQMEGDGIPSLMEDFDED